MVTQCAADFLLRHTLHNDTQIWPDSTRIDTHCKPVHRSVVAEKLAADLVRVSKLPFMSPNRPVEHQGELDKTLSTAILLV